MARIETKKPEIRLKAEGNPVPMTPPNIVTLFRIATAPVLIWILTHTGPAASWLAAGVFFVATVSDFFDGYLARSYDYVTTLGKFLDPMADKLVVTTALIMLAGMARTPHVPAWMVVVLVSREIMVTGLRAVAAAEGLIVGAEELGKYKMSLQAIAIHGLLIHYTHLHIDFFAAGMFILWLAMGVSLWSGVDYYVRVVAALRPKPFAAAGKRAVI
ncbi:MAG TPA: CDP-diacylglycerol--glycerol-3-phosphate 3-phosphatidyltransferase [Candidatus Binatus sp.]|uniref:CDP-diacylglycerol--glycerol-3-phosphate 3-phosphatidyltransferase n=1 Tax=Candidatus Binatus sp. TaxID=2811406 RepID=UPI002B4A480B|nr:CDP-diacylglycerol--glycerol-3-phosphate 3-phosphatidyltransferase [Candidatus Binatus sp.]HKN13417.1 CDP-diacylglycerol--glycerol-3-phosphate 3-phosphatidyltransferase [Candidatus Binatus sp.]